MNAPLFPLATGVAAYEKTQAAGASTLPHFPEVDASELDDRPMAGDEAAIEKDLTNQVLRALQSGRWDGVHVDAWSWSQHKPVKTTQELDDVVVEQLMNHDGARAYLKEWLSSPSGLGAACAMCIATGHAGANATGILEAHNAKGGVR